MEIDKLDARLQRLTETLARLLDGEFEEVDAYSEVPDDLLGQIEETVQFLALDLKTIAVANRDKEASLLLQREELNARKARIDAQLRELDERAETIARQADEIRELSTPVLQIWRGILALPIIGTVDRARSEAIMHGLLQAIAARRARWVILDLTGVEIDTATADGLLRMTRAAAMLGSRCLFSGVSPEVAQTMVRLGVDLGQVTCTRNFEAALSHCLRQDQDQKKEEEA